MYNDEGIAARLAVLARIQIIVIEPIKCEDTRMKSCFELRRLIVIGISYFLLLGTACSQSESGLMVENPVPLASPGAEISSFEDCVAAGYSVLRSHPARCMTKDMQVFIQKSNTEQAQPICKNLCGDGACQEIVCLGSGCPCAESAASCPDDCSS